MVRKCQGDNVLGLRTTSFEVKGEALVRQLVADS